MASKVTIEQAVALAADAGVRFSDAEVALAQARAETGEALVVLEGLLDERVGPKARVFHDYPNLLDLQPAEVEKPAKAAKPKTPWDPPAADPSDVPPTPVEL